MIWLSKEQIQVWRPLVVAFNVLLVFYFSYSINSNVAKQFWSSKCWSRFISDIWIEKQQDWDNCFVYKEEEKAEEIGQEISMRSRLKTYYQRLVAAALSTRNPSISSLTGSCHRNITYIRGHATKSLKLYPKKLSITSTVRMVDKCNSTKICCCCFKET